MAKKLKEKDPEIKINKKQLVWMKIYPIEISIENKKKDIGEILIADTITICDLLDGIDSEFEAYEYLRKGLVLAKIIKEYATESILKAIEKQLDIISSEVQETKEFNKRKAEEIIEAGLNLSKNSNEIEYLKMLAMNLGISTENM